MCRRHPHPGQRRCLDSPCRCTWWTQNLERNKTQGGLNWRWGVVRCRRFPKDGAKAAVSRVSFTLDSLVNLRGSTAQNQFSEECSSESREMLQLPGFLCSEVPLQHWKSNILESLPLCTSYLKAEGTRRVSLKDRKKRKQNREDWFPPGNREDWLFTEVVSTQTTLLAGKRRPEGRFDLVLNSDAKGKQRLKWNEEHLESI